MFLLHPAKPPSPLLPYFYRLSSTASPTLCGFSGLMMAEELLPSEFLADDFFLEGKDKSSGGGGFSSDGSVTGSEEEEEKEEDYLAGLTRQMAHSFLLDDDTAIHHQQKVVLASSPQSTLCAAGAWSTLSSEKASPTGGATVKDGEEQAWDLLCAASGRVCQTGLNDEIHDQQNLVDRGLLGFPQSQRASAPVSAPRGDLASGYYSNSAITQHQLQVARFHQLKQQQLMKQQFCAAWAKQNRSRGVVGSERTAASARPLGLPSSAWPSLQQVQQQAHGVSGSGMRAIFLGGSGGRRESCGTGVFLPRSASSATDLKKKPACSTVLVPARVAQALNLSFDDMGVPNRHGGAPFVLGHGATISIRAKVNQMAGKQMIKPQHQPQEAQEIRLPPEWTY